MNPDFGPPQCLHCGRGNPTEQEVHGDSPPWYIDLERDINWGDPTYLCNDCVEKLLVHAGFVDSSELTEMVDAKQDLEKRVHDLEAKLEQREARFQQVTGGLRVLQEEKKAAKKKTSKATA